MYWCNFWEWRNLHCHHYKGEEWKFSHTFSWSIPNNAMLIAMAYDKKWPITPTSWVIFVINILKSSEPRKSPRLTQYIVLSPKLKIMVIIRFQFHSSPGFDWLTWMCQFNCQTVPCRDRDDFLGEHGKLISTEKNQQINHDLLSRA